MERVFRRYRVNVRRSTKVYRSDTNSPKFTNFSRELPETAVFVGLAGSLTEGKGQGWGRLQELETDLVLGAVVGGTLDLFHVSNAR